MALLARGLGGKRIAFTGGDQHAENLPHVLEVGFHGRTNINFFQGSSSKVQQVTTIVEDLHRGVQYNTPISAPGGSSRSRPAWQGQTGMGGGRLADHLAAP